MATLRELIIKISANSRSFQSEISRASRMGQDYYRTMQNGGRQSAAASREMRRALAEVTDQINTAKSSALNMAGAFAGAFATGHLISLADEWNSVNARLKQASQSSDDFQVSQRELMAISQRTGTAFSDNASLFARSAASMREYGYSSEEVLKVTEAISTGLKLSGASTAEASSVITQFSQALAQGVLRGEEFNSVNESGDRVIRALAAGMGVARKDLKAMADTRASNDAQLLGYGEGSRMRERLQEMWSIRHEFEQKNNELLRQYQAGEIEEALWKQEKELNKKYLEERLSDQQNYYAKADALRNNWNAGLQEGLTNWADSATDYASQAADAVVSTMDGLVSNISDALAGNVVDWRNWGSSILQEVSKILMNAAIVNGLKSLSGAGGWLGTVGGWISGAVANAKGGVYTSANLSAYSNTIVDTPTYFAFAKGAGLMGEAGPEAIMPLTRAADGSLGVRAIGNVNSGGGFVYSPVYHISIQNQGSNGEIDARSARGLVDLIDSRVVSIMQSSRRDGGLYSA
ncbi:phage tail tape measure protein [Escherichia coli]|uniref:phage tail tape measure protein n=1 Tax=Escherichia coli TaxID=562 RepID=UPI00102DBBBF|nr:phage tail tape measure protein [Escherichia coli]EIY0238532.1 phage tail tape measure protein [Escherichia coli]MCS1032010.1 phage tail tape measure protein [Escherichia coli]MCS1046754.1 phage tail tape measure protein [Escherichia coli]MCS1091330.1 phage tail tape measure protein [Escherichia coli]RZZ70299.1 phage tail tape measure protein [Escherichia coli]